MTADVRDGAACSGCGALFVHQSGCTTVVHQLVDDVVRDLVSGYPGTIQSVNLPTPDTAMVRLHRGDSTWLVSIARLEVSGDA